MLTETENSTSKMYNKKNIDHAVQWVIITSLKHIHTKVFTMLYHGFILFEQNLPESSNLFVAV